MFGNFPLPKTHNLFLCLSHIEMSFKVLKVCNHIELNKIRGNSKFVSLLNFSVNS